MTNNNYNYETSQILKYFLTALETRFNEYFTNYDQEATEVFYDNTVYTIFPEDVPVFNALKDILEARDLIAPFFQENIIKQDNYEAWAIFANLDIIFNVKNASDDANTNYENFRKIAATFGLHNLLTTLDEDDLNESKKIIQ